MSGGCIWSEQHEEIWKATQCRTIVGRWAIILSPVFRYILAVAPHYIHVWKKLVSLEACREDYHIRWNDAFISLDTVCRNLLGFCIS